MARPRLNIVVAVAANAVIGSDGDLPWHISADLKRFKAVTMGHPIVMGRKTFESIGRALPGRTNIIVTRQTDYSHDGLNEHCLLVPSLDAAVETCLDESEIMIVGGASIYRAALPRCDRIFLTEVHADFEGETVFPDFDRSQWCETSRERIDDDPQAEVAYSFVVLERRRG